jgi:hypothetical protein
MVSFEPEIPLASQHILESGDEYASADSMVP